MCWGDVSAGNGGSTRTDHSQMPSFLKSFGDACLDPGW